MIFQNSKELLATDIKYKTIYADPPWHEHGGITRGANRHYTLLKTPEILNIFQTILPIINADAHFYIWTTNNFLPDALWIINELNFKYITTITWLKEKIGLGQYYRGRTEHCLFATRGSLKYKYEAHNKRMQGVTGFRESRGKTHSRKPNRMRVMIERVSRPPYLELFARQAHKGWDTFGNELDTITQQSIRDILEIKPR